MATQPLRIHGDIATLLSIVNSEIHNVLKASVGKRFKRFYDTARLVFVGDDKFITNQYVNTLPALSTYRWMMALRCAHHPILKQSPQEVPKWILM
jgi:hypothetical protein